MQLTWQKVALISGLCLVAIIIVAVFWRLEDHDLDRRAAESFDFDVNDTRLAGTLWLPDGQVIAAVTFVHGDGPQDRSSAGGYAPLINTFLDAGIAVASWDKQGVGGSAGNWLDQSMADRAIEVSTALATLNRRLADIPIGAVGFSQAGWVLPRLSSSDVDFIVLVGAAVSWQDQGDYYTRIRLRLSGMNAAGIEQTLTAASIENEDVFGPEARFDLAAVPAGMNEDRWAFIRRNRYEDARDNLGNLDMPVLAIWGAEDLNVDAAGDADIYREIVGARHAANKIAVVPQATHGLLKADPYNTQLVSQWSWYMAAKFLAEGRYAFAPEAIDQIRLWITARANESAY